MKWRKTICTATIFFVMVAALAASLIIQVPYHIWWSKEESGEFLVSLLLWAAEAFLVPLCALIMVFVVLWGLWNGADMLCSKLRKEDE
jgi:hypothetical protein